jgi:H/ACA ribonucleoprotein complex subunit 4
MSILSKNLIYFDESLFEHHKNELLGENPYERTIEKHINSGFIILDKPPGPTSHEIIATIKKLLGLKKAGHSGTLDPSVSGVLPVSLENATKILQTMLTLPKTYICNMRIKNLPENANIDWKKTLNEFKGLIYQYPPLESNVARKLRKRMIYEIKLIDVVDNNILFEVKCESGTYIRTLCEDIGKSIGLSTYMNELRRTQTSIFHEKQAITMHNLFDAFMDYKEDKKEEELRKVIRPVEEGVLHLKQIVVKNDAIRSLTHGVTLGGSGLLAYDSNIEKHDIIAAFSAKSELIGIGQALVNYKNIETERIDVFQIKRVLMSRELYS